MLSGCPSQVTACPSERAQAQRQSPRQPRSRQRRAPEAVGGVRVAEGLPLRAGYAVFAFAAIASLMWSPNTTVLGLLWLTGAVGVWVGTEGVRFPRAAVAIGVATVAMMPAASRMVATPPAAARGASDTAAAVSVADAPRPPGYVSRAEFGDAWPLTVGEGVLECDQSRSALGAVVFSAGGRRYGVNGTAKGLGFPAIDPNWRSPIQKLDYPPLARIPEGRRRRISQASWPARRRDRHGGRRGLLGPSRFYLQTVEVGTNARHYGRDPDGVATSHADWVSIGPLIDRGLKLCAR